jgi:hypothetical protein
MNMKKIFGITLVSLLVATGIVSAMGNPHVSEQVSLFVKTVLRDDVNRTSHPDNENTTKPLENVSGNETGNHENETAPLGNETGNQTGNDENNTGSSGNETRPLENMTGNETGSHENETVPGLGNNTGNETGPSGNETGNETGGQGNTTGYPGNGTGNFTYHPADVNYDGRIVLSELTAYASRYGQYNPDVRSATNIWQHGEFYFWDSASQTWCLM